MSTTRGDLNEIYDNGKWQHFTRLELVRAGYFPNRYAVVTKEKVGALIVVRNLSHALGRHHWSLCQTGFKRILDLEAKRLLRQGYVTLWDALDVKELDLVEGGIWKGTTKPEFIAGIEAQKLARRLGSNVKWYPGRASLPPFTWIDENLDPVAAFGDSDENHERDEALKLL